VNVRVAVLDDYQDVALSCADWDPVLARAEVAVFHDNVVDIDTLADRLSNYDVIVLMRERTPFPRALIEKLENLQLIVTTGRGNASIDVAAASERGVVVSGTDSLSTSPAELTWALILGLARHLDTEVGNIRSGGWQTTVGCGLAGKTLGVVGLGRIGTRVAEVGRAFGMDVLAWSPHLTADRAAVVGAHAVPLNELLSRSDVVTLHLVLSETTRRVIGAAEITLMKRSAFLVNTARSGLLDTHAAVGAVGRGELAGLGLDVFDVEPLPMDDLIRMTTGVLLTPHLGYVTDDVYRLFFRQVVEDILAFWAGDPVRVIAPR
jgi:phosphoglycerate dehydrogenase-like enzyme